MRIKKTSEYLPGWRRIGRLTWPAFVELMLTTVFGMGDLLMLASIREKTTVYKAAVGLTNQPHMLLVAVFAAMNVGATSLVAFNIGNKNPEKANRVASQAVGANIILGILVSILGFALASPIIKFMGAGADTFPYALSYFRIIVIGVAFRALNMAVVASMRGAGQTKLIMYINLTANLLDLLANYVLVYGKWGFPRMEIEGAAWSTTVANMAAGLTCLCVVMFSKRSIIRVKLGQMFRFSKDILWRVLQIGYPAAGEQLVMQSGFAIFTKMVSGLGTQVMAAHQSVLSVLGLCLAPTQAFCVATSVLVGQSLGEGEPGKAERLAKSTRFLANVASVTIGLLIIIFSRQIAFIYDPDPKVMNYAIVALWLAAFMQPSQSTQLVTAAALRGAGDAMYPLYSSIVGIWGLRVLMGLFFVNVLHLGLLGAWLAINLDQIARAVTVTLRFRTGRWKVKLS